MNKFFNFQKHCGAASIYVTQLRERESKCKYWFPGQYKVNVGV